MKGLISFPAPANGIIEYELRTMIPNDTRYTGPPGLGWEQSMSELMSGKSYLRARLTLAVFLQIILSRNAHTYI